MDVVLLFDIRRIDEKMTNQLISQLTPLRREKAKKYLFLEDRKRCVCGERLLQYYLQSYKGIEERIEYGYHPYGKPFFMQYPEIQFNLSHSGNWVICGFSDHSIGVDIEKIHKYRKAIVDRYFTEREKEYLYAEGKELYASRFTELWTLKESYTKYIGKGLSTDLASFSIDVKHDQVIVQDQIQKDIVVKHFRFEDYFISLTTDKECSFVIKSLTFSELMGAQNAASDCRQLTAPLGCH